ncbi:glycosyltransferase family A protein [Rhizobium sp.]|uniref:glycosyltransferase family A protein n=1 Tax=Rhizobium sp. TaxID=391 RepID=UPI0028AD1621
MAKLDILVPHYNDPEGLSLSLQSIAKQDWQGQKRVIIADDGSSLIVQDEIKKIIEEFQKNSRELAPLRIELELNGQNRGRPFTRNVLLDSIESDFVSWLDAGDEWYPNKISRQFEKLHSIEGVPKDQPVWVTCNYDWRWVGGKKRKIRQQTGQDQHKALLMGANLRAYLWTLLGSAESFKCVGYFDERLPRMQDLDYFIRFISHGGVIHNAHRDRTYCVYHKSDLGRNADEIRQCNSLIYDKHRVIYNRYGAQFRKMRLFKMEMLAARFAQSNNDDRKAAHYLWAAFRTRPIAFAKHFTKKGLSA